MSTVILGDNTGFDLATLIETRLLIQAASGGGKSWALRRLLEQSHGKVQQIVLDVEGEFSTLREKGEYILIGGQGDVPIDIGSAGKLAIKLLELGVSTICDLYELEKKDRPQFVQRFLEGLIGAPKALRHPVLVVVDEADQFAPQSKDFESGSTRSVIDLCARGRKRGLTAILATQRISKLHKDCVAECLNKMIGRAHLDLDQRRAGDELGMSKDERLDLRRLSPGEFHVYGPALRVGNKEEIGVIRLKVGPVATTHPHVGSRQIIAPPPATDKIKSVLIELAKLPQQIKQEKTDHDQLVREHAELKRKLFKLETAHPVDAEQANRLAREIEFYKQRCDAISVVCGNALKNLQQLRDLGENAMAQMHDEIRDFREELARIKKETDPPASTKSMVVTRYDPAPQVATIRSFGFEISAPQQRILDALADLERLGVNQVAKNVAAIMSNASPTSSGYTNNLGRLRSLKLVDYPQPGLLALTDEGRLLATGSPSIATLADLHFRWLRQISAPQARILQALIDAYPDAIPKDRLARLAEQSVTSSGYTNNLGRLRSLGAIDYPLPGMAIATKLLFPEGLL